MTLDATTGKPESLDPPSSSPFDQRGMNAGRGRRAPACTSSSDNHASTIAALTIVLEMLERKMAQIRVGDGRSEHVAVLGHIRSALSYERRVLSQLTDPQGMAMMTAEALEKLLASSPSKAVALLEGKRKR